MRFYSFRELLQEEQTHSSLVARFIALNTCKHNCVGLRVAQIEKLGYDARKVLILKLIATALGSFLPEEYPDKVLPPVKNILGSVRPA